MKLKFIPLTVVLIGLSALANGQCVPNQSITNPGFYPNEFATAHKNEAYQHIFQIRMMPDTQIFFLNEWHTAYIDSVKVNDLRNLPTGFTFQCDDADCMFIPDSTGCLVVSGNPTEGQVGEYFVDIDITVWARVDGTIPVIQDETIEDKRLVVSQFSSSVNDLSAIRPVLSPNPNTTGIFSVYGVPTQNLVGQVFDAKGAKVAEVNVENGELDCSQLGQGLYFIQLAGSDGIAAYQKVRIQ